MTIRTAKLADYQVVASAGLSRSRHMDEERGFSQVGARAFGASLRDRREATIWLSLSFWHCAYGWAANMARSATRAQRLRRQSKKLPYGYRLTYGYRFALWRMRSEVRLCLSLTRTDNVI
jgi:hypothetical protein